jgi:hypothetical protein
MSKSVKRGGSTNFFNTIKRKVIMEGNYEQLKKMSIASARKKESLEGNCTTTGTCIANAFNSHKNSTDNVIVNNLDQAGFLSQI